MVARTVDVLVITSLYPPHSYGGYETSCRDVVERWRGQGHEVTVLTTTTRLADVADDPAEHGVRRELTSYWVDHALPPHSWKERVAVERANQEALARALADTRPDVVSCWAMGALSLGLLTTVAERGVPLVLVLLDDWLEYGERVDQWRKPLAGRPRLAALARRVTGLPATWPPADAASAVYCSEATRQTSLRGRWQPARSVVVGAGVDHADFPVLPSPPDRPWSWRLLQVGRIDPRKGLAESVRALAELPEATLEVVGRGDDAHLAELQALAASTGVTDRVAFRGALPRHALAPVYAAADVALFPVRWQEPFGIVPLEAMACGTPVVATGTGGSASFFADGVNCLLVPPGDASALAAAVRRLAQDGQLRRRVVQGGLRTASEHGVDAYAERLEAEHLAAVAR
jgi:glycosyltransferase involved in cell wall biosynthesis